MPPKLKLYSDKKKHKNSSTQQQNEAQNQPASISLTPEQEQQFELELCWCIKQLQIALQSGKLNNKQVKDHTNALNTLMSNSASLIRKRQVMRLSFGDYREKIANEEKKAKSSVVIKVKDATPSKKSMFLKKSVFVSSTGNTFRFNFKPLDDGVNEDEERYMNQLTKPEPVNTKQQFHFLPSDNSFRFNFEVANGSYEINK